MASHLPVLVGEANPLSDVPRRALFPYPPNSAGGRLCRLVLGMNPSAYLRSFERLNLCLREWSGAEAAETIRLRSDLFESLAGRPVVLLGRRVQAAVRRHAAAVPDRAPLATHGRFVLVPHPSGRCRFWNDPGSYARARAVLAAAGIPIGGGP